MLTYVFLDPEPRRAPSQHEPVTVNLRLARALDLIGRGVAVGEVAQRMGYASQAAFSAMFKRAFGVPPSRFIDDGA